MTILEKLQIWITALRSGKYIQGKDDLRSFAKDKDTPERFCCLGVLCDILDNTKWNKKLAGIYKENRWLYIDQGGYLPTKIREMVGLSTKEENGLVLMNSAGKSFNEIANYIEMEILPRYLNDSR